MIMNRHMIIYTDSKKSNVTILNLQKKIKKLLSR